MGTFSWDIVILKEEFLRYIEISNRNVPSRLAICLENNKIIGSVNSYYLDGNHTKRAVGICICNDNYWGMGIGEKALGMWLDYWLVKQKHDEIYCQTWSGNIPMIKLAEKMGFEEVDRMEDKLEVEGTEYDNINYLIRRLIKHK